MDFEEVLLIINGGMDGCRVHQGGPCTSEVPEANLGLYCIKIENSVNQTISTEFVEVGKADTTPLNGWYWPTLNTKNPNLYECEGPNTPLKDYDEIYGSHEWDAEEAKGSSIDPKDDWEGHCWGWCLAAIALPSSPQPVEKNNLTFTRDEMQGLYVELADTAPSGAWEWLVGGPREAALPAAPVTVAQGEAIDGSADDVHNALRGNIRGEGRALIANLRDCRGEAEKQIWNHDIYEYVSTMIEAPGGNERVIYVTTLITSNAGGDIMLPDSANRSDTYEYILEYRREDGQIDEGSSNQKGVKCSGFPPGSVGIVHPDRMVWNARHCAFTKEKVDALYH